MRILISGASGFVGSLVRELFAGHDVALLSRRPVSTDARETWFHSGDLWNSDWWNQVPEHQRFEFVFHLAESVKTALSDEACEAVVENHVAFIRHFSAQGAKVVYPLTAYMYDRRLSRTNASYVRIKGSVYAHLRSEANISFPIIHPVCDVDRGLGTLIRFEARIPYANLLCAFDATIPVLHLADLKAFLAHPESMAPGQFDLYSDLQEIRDLFHKESRVDTTGVSRTALQMAKLLRFVPSLSLLVNGRRI